LRLKNCAGGKEYVLVGTKGQVSVREKRLSTQSAMTLWKKKLLWVLSKKTPKGPDEGEQ